ncbi:MAG: hypothetical protein COB66_08725 [Coxiella sp. (in: Bacteria)]|nr:MAG: hypothetical protein COB66_08725 [Coxiella sp. (in: g-proteobacteria)]
MSVKKILMLTAAAGFALASANVLAGGPDRMGGMCDAAHVHHGFYLGGGAARLLGYSNSSYNSQLNYSAGLNGWGGQLFAGYDAMVTPHFLLGGNAFIGFYDTHVQRHDLANTGGLKLNYMYGLSVEPGYMVASNVHLFARLGFAEGDFDINDAGNSSNFEKFGWLIGVGSDVAITDQFSIRGMYTHYEFQKKTTTTPTSTVQPRFGEFMLGLTYHM